MSYNPFSRCDPIPLAHAPSQGCAAWRHAGGASALSARTLGEVGQQKSPHVRAGCTFNGADDGVRTRDPDLGKVVLYQLSHVRVVGGTRFELVTPTVSR